MAGSNGQTGTCGCAASSEPADTGILPGSSMASIVVSGKQRCNRHQSGSVADTAAVSKQLQVPAGRYVGTG